MSELLIRINLDNSAFEDEEREIKRILNKVKDNLDIIIGEKETLILRDINGNRTGFAKLNNSLTIEDINEMIEKRIKNKEITRSEQDNLIVLLTYLRTYEMVM